jgi:hypothetical protein
MKNFLVRILLAAAVTLVASALASSARAQQSDEDPTPVNPPQTQPKTTPQTPAQHDSADASARDAQTQEALAFTGRVTKEQGQFVLNDPVTKMNYQLDDQAKARPFVGKQVKVIGKLEMKSNTIHIDSIEPLS